jgi:hypothetical protein
LSSAAWVTPFDNRKLSNPKVGLVSASCPIPAMLARSAEETLGDRRMISRYAATIGSSVPIVDAARSIPSAWVVDR